MSKELIVSVGRHETRVAILEDDQVVELFHEREKEYSLAGSIHKGRVTRVLPGMQSAFVDIGLDRDAFLYVSDFFEDNEEYDAVVSTVEDQVLKLEKGDQPERGGRGRDRERGGRGDRGDRGDRPERADRPDRNERPDRSERNERQERPERVAPAENAAEPDEVAVAAAELIATPGPATEAVVSAQAPAAERRDGRPERPKGERGERGERGGRGRRGRRRRGGRGGSALPESKFFSPKHEETRPETSAEADEDETDEAPVTPAARAAADDDFMVLPGESLAKYTADEAPAEKAEEPAVVTATAPAEFGVVASWVAQKKAADAMKGDELAAPRGWVESVSVEPEPAESVPAVAATEAEREPVAAALPEEVLEQSDDDEGISAGEVAEIELGEEVLLAQEVDGPEPARIPTSLTATLREQGHRYPHRVSRRMRRKMRGGDQGEESQKAPAAAEAPPQEETREVAPREERRPERAPREAREPREPRAERERERERPPLPSISDLLKEGQEIIVQIAKEPLGQKGARITSHIALPGRFVVYMPTVEHVGVSRKIPSDEERQRLKRVLQTHRQGVPGGFICRTAAENKSEEELRSDMHFLYNLWLDMRQKAEKKPAPQLLHHDLDLVQRILRDQLTTSFKTIWVDNEELYADILSFVERFQPGLIGRVKLYTRSNPIFDEFGITAEVEKALRPKVWLKSGGYIVINQTEALVAIDINTGKYVGKSNHLEDTIVKVNTDAIKEIVRQIRLRDLGGIIVVDFIDMDERKNRQKVMGALEDAMRVDRAPYKILQFNDFGLVAITRKRVKQSLERTLCSPCPYCEAAGYVKSVQTVITEILQEAQRIRKALEGEQGNLVLRVNPEVAKVLKSNHNAYMQEIEETLGKTVMVKSDPLLHQTKFDLA